MITWKNGTNGEFVEIFKNLSKDAVQDKTAKNTS